MIIPGTVDPDRIDSASDDELVAQFVASGLYTDGAAGHAVRVLRGEVGEDLELSDALRRLLAAPVKVRRPSPSSDEPA